MTGAGNRGALTLWRERGKVDMVLGTIAGMRTLGLGTREGGGGGLGRERERMGHGLQYSPIHK